MQLQQIQLGGFYSKLVRLEVMSMGLNPADYQVFLFQTGSIRRLYLYLRKSEQRVSIPNWFD